LDYEIPQSALAPVAGERQLGLGTTTALVIGNVIGAGIFLLPATLAPYGRNAVYGWLVTIGGVICLAGVLAHLSRSIRGGPFAYVQQAFGALPAFLVMWGILISIWAALAGISIAAISYLSRLVPALGRPVTAPTAAIATVWLLILVNSRGARTAGWVQVLTTVLKVLPLIAVALVAAVFLGRGAEPAVQSTSPISAGAIAASAALSIFSMIGFESATFPADKIRDPERTMPRATIIGTLITGLIYLAACSAVLYLLPGSKAAVSHAPFADAVAPLIGAPASMAITMFAVISAIGCLNGWALCSGEVPLRLARENVFPRWFLKTTRIGTPVRAQLLAAAMATLLIASNYSRSLTGLFAFLSLISTVASLLLYSTCAAAALVLARRNPGAPPLLLIVAPIGLLFSFWGFWGAGAEPTLWGFGMIATGLPVWFAMRFNSARRESSMQSAAGSGGIADT
jgi:APA family basic amino acid/polyamine antiporter